VLGEGGNGTRTLQLRDASRAWRSGQGNVELRQRRTRWEAHSFSSWRGPAVRRLGERGNASLGIFAELAKGGCFAMSAADGRLEDTGTLPGWTFFFKGS
jgi:hypothetical protein